MADTTFIDKQTPISAAWLNDVNNYVYKDSILVKQYGVKGDGTTDDTSAAQAAANAKTYVQFPEASYKMALFPSKTNVVFRAFGTVNINLFNAGDASMVKLQSGSYYEGFKFNSTEADLNSQRVAIDDRSNVQVSRCGFFNFKNPTNGNGWGTLIQRSTDVVLDQCSFGGNTLADIAITDACRDITVIHPTNTVDGGVTLDIEPNTADGLVGGNFIGGHYKKVSLLENQTTGYASRNLVFSGCRIDTLVYDGAGAQFNNCQISSIIPESSLNTFAGALMIDSANLGPNLLTDPYLFDVSPFDATCFWTAYVSSTAGYKRINDSTYGKYCRINPNKVSQQVIITTRNYIPVTAGEALMLFLRSRCDNSGTGAVSTGHVVVQWYDSGNALLSVTNIYNNRATVNTFTDWANDIAILKVPTSAVNCKVRLTTDYNNNTTAALDVGAVGLFRFSLLPQGGGNGNMPQVIGRLSEINTDITYLQDQAPSGSQAYPGGLVGDRIIRKTPVVGQPKGWRCTTAPAVLGDAGTWVSEGNL